MIRVTVELLPLGREDQKRLLGTAVIANDGTGDLERGNYNVRLLTGDPPISRQAGKPYRHGHVDGFNRKRSPWRLVALAIEACGVKA